MKREDIIDDTHAREIELRVLYGPQAGCRLILSGGKYAIGSSENCEIILNGPRIEQEHAVIDFEDFFPNISPVEGKITDAQGKQIIDRIPVNFGMPIELGGIWIAIDYVDAPWPDPVEVAPIHAGPPVEISSFSHADDTDDTTSQNTVVAADRLTSYKSILFAIPLLLFIVIAASGTYLSFFSFDNSDDQLLNIEEKKQDKPDYIEQLKVELGKIIENDHFSISVGADNAPKVIAYAINSESRKKAEKLIAKFDPKLHTEIFIESEIQSNVQNFIDESISINRAKLKIDNFTNGNLYLSGSVSSQNVKDELYDLIKKSIPGIKQISGSIVLAEDLPQKFEEEISNTGLSRRFQIISKQPEFLLRGKLPEGEIENWEKLLLRFTESYGNLLPIRANITTLKNSVPVNIETIVGGTTSFVITKKGERIERGGDLNGNILTVVKDTEIIFDGSERFRIGR